MEKRWNHDSTQPLDGAVESEGKEDAEFEAAFAEHTYNNKAISWRYWVEQMPAWTPAQAARLMCALDPDIFENLTNRPNQNDPSDLVLKAKQIQRLAETQGVGSLSPCKWLEWANSHKLQVHIGLSLAVF